MGTPGLEPPMDGLGVCFRPVGMGKVLVQRWVGRGGGFVASGERKKGKVNMFFFFFAFLFPSSSRPALPGLPPPPPVIVGKNVKKKEEERKTKQNRVRGDDNFRGTCEMHYSALTHRLHGNGLT